jgi:polysaccharide pyruvyl transferase WcaK-like protein
MRPRHLLNQGNRRRQKICFFGHFGMFNSGNESTFQAILFHLQRLIPEAEITCICDHPEVVAATYNIEAIPIRSEVVKPLWLLGHPIARYLRKIVIGIPSELYRWLAGIRILKSMDVFIVPGTGLLTDAYGLMGWGPYSLFKWSLIARMCRCKVLFVSVGAGPVHSALGKYFVKAALSLADFRSYRDKTSLKYLKSIGFSTNSDGVYPDLAFSFPEALMPAQNYNRGRRRVVGIGLMEDAGKYGTATPGEAVYDLYLNNLLGFAQWLLSQDYDIRLLIGDIADKPVAEGFRSLLRRRLGSYDQDRVFDEPIVTVEQILSQLAATDIVVATRFHNVLLALLLEKPVIAISFHHKCASLMEDMGLSDYCQDINHIDTDRLVKQFKDLKRNAEKLKPAIRQKIEQSRKALDEQYGLIFKRA